MNQVGWFRRLGQYVLRYRGDLALGIGGAVVASACLTAVPLISRQIVDNVIINHHSRLLPWLLLLGITALAGFFFSYLRRYQGGRVALAVQYDLRNDMQEHLQRLDFANLDTMPTGQLVGRSTSDSTLVQGFLNQIPNLSGNVLTVMLSLAVMVYLSPLLAVVSIILAPSVLLVSYRMRWRMFPATWDGQQREGDVVQIVDEGINGVRVVKAFGQEGRELNRLVEAAKRLFGSQMRPVRIQARYQPILAAIPSLGQVAILALGGWLALHHHITLGTFLAFSTYVTQFISPARQLANVLTTAQQARAGAERIFQLLDIEPAIADAPDAVTLPPVSGEITFSGVRFAYGDGPTVLDDFDLHIAAGERVAIIGPSGSGKSTAALLVSRFYDPDEGCVLVDGHDVRSVTLHSLRRQVGYAFEESFLFSDTVRANIAYGKPGASDEEIEAAARAAQAHEFVQELPRGYDTVVGERGLNLSGGQRQRIALARAILSDPRILILDDATSAIDAKIEESIHDALREVMANRTTILIAHRRSTLHLADRIVVLEHGHIVEDGTHEELVARSATYRSMLSGLDEEVAEQIGDRIEALSSLAGAAQAQGVTPSAWVASNGAPASTGASLAASYQPPRLGLGLGAGGGGGVGSGRARGRSLAATPELLARVAALPPVRDEAVVDVEWEARHDRRFNLPRLLNEFRRPLLLGLLLVVLDALASLVGPDLVRWGINGGVAAGSTAVLFGAAGIYLAVTLADLVDEIGDTFVTGRAAQRVMLTLRIRIWAQLQRLSLDYYEREMAGRIMTRMTTDVDQFESLIENGVLSALVSIVTFFGIGVALVVMNTELGLCTLSVAIPMGVATSIFRRRSSRLYSVARDRIAVMNADFQESLSGVRESQAFVHEEESIAHFHHLNDRYQKARVAAQQLLALYFPFVQFLSAVATGIVLGVGATLIASGHLTSGALVAFILYISMFFSPIQQLSQVFSSWQQTRISMDRVAELMRMESLTPSAEEPIVPGRLRGRLELKDVHFTYPETMTQLTAEEPRRGPRDPRLPIVADVAPKRPPEALRGIDLRIEPGETVALVGETGAGKSTVVKLLARFYDPVEGGVFIDGYDLRSLDLTAFRRQLGYVPQEAFLFTGSIRDNIAYGRPEATDAEVEAAARAVGAHDFIAELPGGYRHQLAERGRSISTGQRQLIALARAELVDPAVLLLDEATSNLDLLTEARVSAAMQRISHRRTTVVIAHRLQTARSADRIVVLDHGRIIEVGSHEELLARGGKYASMWEAFELVGQGAA